MIDIKAIRELCESAKVENDYSEPVYGSDTYQLIVNKIPTLLDELEMAQNKQRWIPVTERLPTECDADEGYTVLAIHKTAKKKYYHWRSVADNPFDFTHWMPLPETPKGESHE